MNELMIAACITIYTSAIEFRNELEDWKELQQQAADDFCNLIKLDKVEFNKLGLILLP